MCTQLAWNQTSQSSQTTPLSDHKTVEAQIPQGSLIESPFIVCDDKQSRSWTSQAHVRILKLCTKSKWKYLDGMVSCEKFIGYIVTIVDWS